jgi:outer membrane immunogenic protein
MMQPFAILRLFLLATTALVSVELASAQELPQPNSGHRLVLRLGKPIDAPKKPAFNWTGFHIGIGGGASFLRADASVHSHVTQQHVANPNYPGYFESYTVNQSINRTLNAAGAFGTLSFGYDVQDGMAVFGGFGDLNLASLSAKASTVDTTPSSVDTPIPTLLPATATLSHKVDLGSSVDIGGRLGFLATERTLLYGLAGLSFAQIDAKSTLTVQHDPLSALTNFSLATQSGGWRGGEVVGAGVEFMLTDRISLQTEYRYADYGKIKSQNAVTLPGGSATISQSDAVTNQTIRAVLSYHF